MIEEAREYALEEIGASRDDIERGLKLHEELFACDLFGFLPSTVSRKGHALLKEMVENGASNTEMIPVKEVIAKTSPIYDQESRTQFLDSIACTGLDCTVLTAGSEKSLHHSLNRISASLHLLDELDEHLQKSTCVDDVQQAQREGKLAVFCSTNCAPAQSGLADGMDAHWWIDVMYRLGIRIMHLTYNRRNWVGDGCLEPADGGLSLHGREVVKHLNRIGIVVDTAHSGRQTTLDAVGVSRLPIMATHTTCKGIYDYPRGKTDEELRAIADGGGLVGICILPYFLRPRGGLSDLLDHIDYAVDLIGPDHVAIGTDSTFSPPLLPGCESLDWPTTSSFAADEWYGAWDYAPERLEIPEGKRRSLSWSNWPYFTVGLVARGYSEEDIAKLLGENFLRVVDEVQRGKTCEAVALHRVHPRHSNRSTEVLEPKEDREHS